MIISDLFVVRSYSHPDAWAPGELMMPGAPNAPAPMKKPLPSVSNTHLSVPGSSSSRPRQEPMNSLAQLQADPILQSVVRPLLFASSDATSYHPLPSVSISLSISDHC